jgi:hypothetical protein
LIDIYNPELQQSVFSLIFFKTLKTIAKINGNLMLQMENNYIAAMKNIKFVKKGSP